MAPSGPLSEFAVGTEPSLTTMGSPPFREACAPNPQHTSGVMMATTFYVLWRFLSPGSTQDSASQLGRIVAFTSRPGPSSCGIESARRLTQRIACLCVVLVCCVRARVGCAAERALVQLVNNGADKHREFGVCAPRWCVLPPRPRHRRSLGFANGKLRWQPDGSQMAPSGRRLAAIRRAIRP